MEQSIANEDQREEGGDSQGILNDEVQMLDDEDVPEK